MKSFEWILEHVDAHLSQDGRPLTLPDVLVPEAVSNLPDDRIFSVMTRRVFRSGLSHALVDKKWPAFEEAFWGFDPVKISLMSDDQLEALMQNDKLIRHWGKIKAARVNANMIAELSDKHGSFGAFLAQWPDEDLVGLWQYLKKHGSNLGGNSGPYFLRMIGRDTFILTDDVVASLIAQNIVTKKPTAQRDLKAVQTAFNTWHEQSGWPYAHISRLLSYTIGWD
ncbi:MAG: DNA-3-methyladenine glycosylase I [Pontibacterium sp.]